jgi:serine/threonine protein phosphatase 1
MSLSSLAQAEPRPGSYPPAPDGATLYVVGDVHGRLDLLERVHHAIDRDRANAQHPVEIYIGDYIDRGPASAAVVSCLTRRAHGTVLIFLRGNHEQLLLDFLAGENCLDDWKSMGGVATMLSYGVKPNILARGVPSAAVRWALEERLPAAHASFYEGTRPYCCMGPYVFVHAGVRPGRKIEQQAAGDLLGIREEFLRFDGDFGRIVVHGHTPVAAADFRPNRINIDTGAYATNRLTCLRIGEAGASVLSA